MTTNDIATTEHINSLNKKIENLSDQISKLLTAFTAPRSETWLTYKQVMERYNISKSHLSDLTREGTMPYTDEYGVRLYPQSQIEKRLQDGMKNKKPTL